MNLLKAFGINGTKALRNMANSKKGKKKPKPKPKQAPQNPAYKKK